MNTKDPILTQTKELLLPDEHGNKTIKAELKIQSFKEPIWKTGEIVYTMATIIRFDSKNAWGLGYYPDIMDEEEMKDKISELADNPQTIKLPFV